MKKLILFLAIFMLLVAVACSNEENQANSNVDESTNNQVNEETESSGQGENQETEQEDDSNKKLATSEQPQDEIKNKAQEIINALANNDTKKLAEYVHSTKGLLFSPYVYVEEDAVVFDKNKVENMLESSTEYNWGTMDGSGEPIELTPKDYYSRFVYSNSFTDADEVLIDKDMKRGNTINNIKEVFPNSKVVEFFINGSEEYAGMDWQSLNVVLQKDEDGIWKLVALVHDEWTI